MEYLLCLWNVFSMKCPIYKCPFYDNVLHKMSFYEMSFYEMSFYEISFYEMSFYQMSFYELSFYEMSFYEMSQRLSYHINPLEWHVVFGVLFPFTCLQSVYIQYDLQHELYGHYSSHFIWFQFLASNLLSFS